MSESWRAFAAGQRLVLGVIVGAAALAKLTSPHADRTARRSALARLIQDERAMGWAWKSATAVEVLLTAGLLMPWRGRAPAAAAAGFFLLSTAYAAWAARYARGAPCGCFGAASSASVSARDVARSAALTLAGAVAVSQPYAWTRSFRSVPAVLALLAEAVAVTKAFPELARVLAHLRRRRAVECATGTELTRTQARARLEISRAWRELSGYLVISELDAWRDGCFWFFAGQARHGSADATAVFGVHVDVRADYVHGVLTSGSDEVVLRSGGSPGPHLPGADLTNGESRPGRASSAARV